MGSFAGVCKASNLAVVIAAIAADHGHVPVNFRCAILWGVVNFKSYHLSVIKFSVTALKLVVKLPSVNLFWHFF